MYYLFISWWVNEWRWDGIASTHASISEMFQCYTHYLADELVNEKEKYKSIADEMDQAFSELSGF